MSKQKQQPVIYYLTLESTIIVRLKIALMTRNANSFQLLQIGPAISNNLIF